MTPLVEKTKDYIFALTPDDKGVKALSLVPLINNIFLEIKKRQLFESDKKSLLEIAELVSIYRIGHVIYAPLLAKAMEYLSFKWRFISLASLAAIYIFSEKHIESIIHQCQKTP